MKSTQLLSLFCLASSSLLHASDDLAAAAQNPIASMISLPIDSPSGLSRGGYYNVVAPDGAPQWSLNLAVAFLFPKS